MGFGKGFNEAVLADWYVDYRQTSTLCATFGITDCFRLQTLVKNTKIFFSMKFQPISQRQISLSWREKRIFTVKYDVKNSTISIRIPVFGKFWIIGIPNQMTKSRVLTKNDLPQVSFS